MADSSSFNKRSSCAICMGVACLAALFFASHSNALTDDASNVVLPLVQPQSQTQMDLGTPHKKVAGKFVEYGTSTNNCDDSIEHYALSSLTQNTQNAQTNPAGGNHNSGPTYAAYQSPHYNYTCTNGWGAFDGCAAHAENWLMWPPSYDIQCQVNMPKVNWSPAE